MNLQKKGYTAFFLFVAVVAIFLKLLSMMGFAQMNPILIGIIGGCFAVFAVVFWVVASSVNAIAQSALYLQVMKKETLADFDNHLLSDVYVDLKR